MREIGPSLTAPHQSVNGAVDALIAPAVLYSTLLASTPLGLHRAPVCISAEAVLADKEMATAIE
jgi:hypothetical protein